MYSKRGIVMTKSNLGLTNKGLYKSRMYTKYFIQNNEYTVCIVSK